MSAAPPLLEVDRLTVRFGPSTVVDDVSFSIAAGEKFALVGESGSGKSITALSVLQLVDGAETSGAIRFGHWRRRRRTRGNSRSSRAPGNTARSRHGRRQTAR
jgi:ABC-type glutathione transport system ATPase component